MLRSCIFISIAYIFVILERSAETGNKLINKKQREFQIHAYFDYTKKFGVGEKIKSDKFEQKKWTDL